MSAEQIVEAFKTAAAAKRALRIVGGGSKAFYGHAVEGDLLETLSHQGIAGYEPTELVITARCGTPLAEVEKALADNGQMLPFEPPYFGGSAQTQPLPLQPGAEWQESAPYALVAREAVAALLADRDAPS